MRSLSILLIALSVGSLATTGALAQDQQNAPAKNQATGTTSSGSDTTGSTGSINGRRDAPPAGTAAAASSAAGRPETATGLDLNGPAVRYPSGKAPE